MKLVWTAKNI